jgi:hypothetical protein
VEKYLPSKGITLGLIFRRNPSCPEVEEDKAVENLTERSANRMKGLLDERNWLYSL